jgi:hypothetical protein
MCEQPESTLHQWGPRVSDQGVMHPIARGTVNRQWCLLFRDFPDNGMVLPSSSYKCCNCCHPTAPQLNTKINNPMLGLNC